jgi:hypothetical protein
MAETNQQQLLKSISSLLEKNNIPYMITGAWSVIYYARPRASHDIDFIIEAKKEEIDNVIKAFESLSSEFNVDLDAIKNAILKKDMFNILHLPTMLKFDFWLLTDEAFDQSRFRRRRRVNMLGTLMSIASQEDTILKKLQWYKMSKIEKHLIDAAFVYQIQKKNLDLPYLTKWSKILKTEKLLKSLPKMNLEEYI